MGGGAGGGVRRRAVLTPRSGSPPGLGASGVRPRTPSPSGPGGRTAGRPARTLRSPDQAAAGRPRRRAVRRLADGRLTVGRRLAVGQGPRPNRTAGRSRRAEPHHPVGSRTGAARRTGRGRGGCRAPPTRRISTSATTRSTSPATSNVTPSGTRKPVLMPTFGSTRTPASPSAFMTSSVQDSLSADQVTVCVPGPDADDAPERLIGGGVDRAFGPGALLDDGRGHPRAVDVGDLGVLHTLQVGVHVGAVGDADEDLLRRGDAGDRHPDVDVETVHHPLRGVGEVDRVVGPGGEREGRGVELLEVFLEEPVVARLRAGDEQPDATEHEAERRQQQQDPDDERDDPASSHELRRRRRSACRRGGPSSGRPAPCPPR